MHPFHAPQSKMFIAAGKHVLCEKPVTMNAREAREVIAFAKEKNVFFMEVSYS